MTRTRNRAAKPLATVTLGLALMAGVIASAALASDPAAANEPDAAKAQNKAKKKRKKKPRKNETPVVSVAGTLRGRVRFDGDPPAREALDRTTDPLCARTRELDAAIVVADGGLADVFVALATPGLPAAEPPTAPVTITQQACVYRPRVVGLVTGQKLVVANDDATLHNVHAYRAGETAFNLAQPPRAPAVGRTLAGAGDVIELKCDVHPWMRAYAVLSAHAHFAVTDAHGSFVLADLPPGPHLLEAWHPVLGRVSADVTVSAGATVEVTLVYRAETR
jgi:hypothetical protein